MTFHHEESARPTIAVVVPNRNDSKHLSRCLESVLGQENLPDEVVVVDDQSTDDSVAVIRRHIDGKQIARLLTNEVNLGTNASVNAAARLLRSEFFLSLSANDFVLPGIFHRARDLLQRDPRAGIWSARSVLVGEDDRVLGVQRSPVLGLSDQILPPARSQKMAMRLGNWFTGPTMIFRRRAFLEAGGFEDTFGGLADLVLALVLAVRHGATYSPGVYGAMRVHGGGLLSRTLQDGDAVNMLMQKIMARGPSFESQLFTNAFQNRLDRRLRFAAIRSSGGAAMETFICSRAGREWDALRTVARTIPSSMRSIRVAAAFLLLRPFDIMPTLWHRYLLPILARS